MRDFIRDLYPLKAQFNRNEPVIMVVELFNPLDEAVNLKVEMKVTFLNQIDEERDFNIDLNSGEFRLTDIHLKPRSDDFKGFGTDMHLYCRGELLQSFSSSFDVASDWRKSTRYGFLSDFYAKDSRDDEAVKNLRKLHINLIQFYDWMYRHDELVSKEPEYKDLMGRILCLETVRDKISCCHTYGMKTIAYGAVYAASSEFYSRHKDWALYDSSGKALNFINIFHIMNISPDSPWQNHIIGQYKNAVVQLDFDGIHMDTYGFPKTAISKLNGIDRIERLEEHFPVLINNTREELEKNKEDICLIFNNVGNWPVESTACAQQDAVYIEVWKPYERYHHIQQLITWARHLGREKPVILAAYLKPFIEETDTAGYRAETAALILTAVIAANGGYHMLLGEKNGILTQGYYVDYSKIDDAFMRTVRNYYDFIVRYANLFFDSMMKDVSMTHTDGDNMEYIFDNIKYSTWGEPDKVWVVVRESSKYKAVSFINLTGNDDLWNTGKEGPFPVSDITVKMQLDSGVNSVFLATPDNEMGRPQTVDWSIEDGGRGKVLIARVPKVTVWSLLVAELS